MNATSARQMIETAWKANGNIVVTSDIHAFHKNLAAGSSSWESKDGCRPFANQFEMTDVVIDNINSVCGADDILLHLGDFAFGNAANIALARKQIKCKNIITLFGNHDHHIRNHTEYSGLFTACLDYLEFTINGTLFCAFHYPIEEWNEMNRGSVHIFGHRHTKGRIFRNGRSMDIGLDSNDCKPYKLEELHHVMTSVATVRLHHGEPR